MRFVVDANILFSLAKESSVTSKIIEDYDITLLAPEFCLAELRKYADVIVKKAQAKNFEVVLQRIKSFVIFVDVNKYKEYLAKAIQSLSDENDIAYLALALKLGCPIWSNDKQLKEESPVAVVSTEDLLDLIS